MDFYVIVLEYLGRYPESRPIDIARELHQVDKNIPAISKSANRILYTLEKEGKVRKTTNQFGTQPRWSLI